MSTYVIHSKLETLPSGVDNTGRNEYVIFFEAVDNDQVASVLKDNNIVANYMNETGYPLDEVYISKLEKTYRLKIGLGKSE